MLWTENTNFTIKVERLEIMDVKVSDGSFCFRTKGSRFKPSAPIKYGDRPRKDRKIRCILYFLLLLFNAGAVCFIPQT